MSADRPPRRSGEPNRARGTRITSRRPAPPPPASAPAPGPARFRRGRRDGPGGPAGPADDGLERLQKVLAGAGLGSRRACEELITAGRVEVDRVVVTQLGTRVDPHRQEIRVDGERLPDPKRVVYMLFKPVGVVTTNYDPDGRPRVVDLVPGERRLFAIGRLDRMSEGLILVTNDGDLANLLAHPRYGVEKRYLVQVAGVPTPETLDKLRRGIGLAEGMARAQHVHLKTQHKQSAVLEMVLDEGKNREIRRMLARLGHKVHQLKRVAVGNLSLGALLPGQCRQLTWAEVEALRRDALEQTGGETAPAGRRPPPREGRRPGGQARPGRRPFPAGRGGDRSGAEPGEGDRPVGRPPRGGGRPGGGRPPVGSGRPGSGRPPIGGGRPPVGSGRPGGGRPPMGGGRPGGGRPPIGGGRPPVGGGRPGGGRPAGSRRPPVGDGGPVGGGEAGAGPPRRPPRTGQGNARPPRLPDGAIPPPPPGRRRRPGKASSWRKRREE
ncbi:MAG: pseudouridine synthase [Planctomycetaceae bacterium]